MTPYALSVAWSEVEFVRRAGHHVTTDGVHVDGEPLMPRGWLGVIVDEAGVAGRLAEKWARLAVTCGGRAEVGGHAGRFHLTLNVARPALVELANHAARRAEQARVRELPDAEPVVRCACSRRRAAGDKSCLRSCCCGGDGWRTTDVAEVDCYCIDDQQVDGDGEDLDRAYDEWKDGDR